MCPVLAGCPPLICPLQSGVSRRPPPAPTCPDPSLAISLGTTLEPDSRAAVCWDLLPIKMRMRRMWFWMRYGPKKIQLTSGSWFFLRSMHTLHIQWSLYCIRQWETFQLSRHILNFIIHLILMIWNNIEWIIVTTTKSLSKHLVYVEDLPDACLQNPESLEMVVGKCRGSSTVACWVV